MQQQQQTQQSQQQQQQQHQPLQEINQEDLAAILPDQEHEDAPFDGFEDSESGRLVSKAIERMSLGADSDTSENGDQNPVPVYSSSLLQQFVEKTALLSEPRKRRSKLGKKMNDSEYPCVSNVSPDSGIQSVDNSPLHLAVSPVSPPAPTQSPAQTVVSKPVVNVDRVLYPPKRKPGRPAKTASTQPRGPGRPRLKPEVAEKIDKIERTEKVDKIEKSDRSEKNDRSERSERNEKKEAASSLQQQKIAKEEPTKRSKAKTMQHRNTATSKEDKEDEAETTKKLKAKQPICQKKRSCTASKQISQGRMSGKRNNGNSPARVKCLSRTVTSSKCSREMVRCDGRTCKKMRKDKPGVGNKTTVSLRRQKQLSCERPTNDRRTINSNKRGLKENRSNSGPMNKRQTSPKKVVAPVTRRVLKENKNSKKTSTAFETNGVGVQTLISLPVGQVLKAEKEENVPNKCDKATQPIHNHCHKHHHHKHRRRLLLPPKDPIRIDPCIIQELEKLIEEFSKSCSLGRSNANVAYSELPQIFRVKKLTKKRKGDVTASDDQKLKRRSKKEKILSGTDSKGSANANANSNPNEQRLPLKKRHYHVSSPHSSQSSNASCDAAANETNCTENHIEEAIEATITRYGGGVRGSGGGDVGSGGDGSGGDGNGEGSSSSGGTGGTGGSSSSQEDALPVTPKKRHRDSENANVDKSSAACSESLEEKSLGQAEPQPRRKKKIVKDLRVTVTKLPVEGHGAYEKVDKTDKSDGKVEKSEKSANDSKNLKNHVDKNGKAEKIITEKLIKADKNQTDKLEKSEVLSEPGRLEKCIKVDAGEFVSETYDENETTNENKSTESNNGSNVPNPLNSAAVLVLAKKKMRRRKAINRTGFPTLKKKKKRSLNASETSTDTSKGTLATDNVADEIDNCNSAKEVIEDSAVDSKPAVLTAEIKEVLPCEHVGKQTSNNNGTQNRGASKAAANLNSEDTKSIKNTDSTKQAESSGKGCSDERSESRPGQLRVRKDLVESESDSASSNKFCPVKFEKVQDSRIYDENAPLEESLERYVSNQQQRIAELNEENVKKLERASCHANIKTEHSGPFNGNQKKRRGSSSPCNIIPRNIKRLRSAGYDTENETLPNTDILRGDEAPAHLTSTHTRKKQSRWKKRYLQGGILHDCSKDCDSKTRGGGGTSSGNGGGSSTDNTSGRSKIVCEANESMSMALLSASYQCGKFLRQRKMSFQLPYDLWWLHTQSRLPGRESVPSWNYK